MSRKTFYTGLVIVAYIVLTTTLVIVERNAPETHIASFPDAVWYSIVTLTTVGYGDTYPITPAGRIIGGIFVLGSLGVLGLLISRITETFVNIRETRKMGLLGTKFTGHIVVIGWDQFAQSVVDELIGAEKKVAIVTDDRGIVDMIYERYPVSDVHVLVADYTNYAVLEKANIAQASTVFINFEDDTQKLVYSLNLKKHHSDVQHVVILNNTDLEDTFHAAGVTFTLSKDDIASKIVASYIFEPDVAQYTVGLLSSAVSDEDYDIQQFMVTHTNQYVGMKYEEVFHHLKSNHNVILIGISKMTSGGKRQLLKNPVDQVTVAEKDYLIMIMSGKDEQPIGAMFGVKEGFIS